VQSGNFIFSYINLPSFLANKDSPPGILVLPSKNTMKHLAYFCSQQEDYYTQKKNEKYPSRRFFGFVKAIPFLFKFL